MKTTSEPKARAYSYIRMSTDIQLRGDSLRRQAEASRRYADDNNLELIEDFTLQDIGVSAFKGDNVTSGALGKFLEAVRAKRVPAGSFLLVESLDRISRQELMSSVSLFFDIIKSGISVVTLADGHVFKAGQTEMTDLIIAMVILSRAYEESKTKSHRVGAAWANKRKNAAQRPLTKMAPAWLTLSEDRSEFHVNLERAKVVAEIFNLADRGFGSFVIARRLNSAAIPTFQKSKGWHEGYVTRILNNRSVLGEFQPHRFSELGKREPEGAPIAGIIPRLSITTNSCE